MPNSPEAAGRTGWSDGCDREALAQLGEECLRRAAVQIPQHAVVVEDGHLVMRKDHREEIAVRACAVAARLRHPRGGGGAVMPVGDVDRGQGVERARQRRDGGVVVDHPELVAHAVVGGDVDVGGAPAAARASMASICGAAG